MSRLAPCAVVLLLTCAAKPPPAVTPACDCNRWGGPRSVGTIQEPLGELSGLVASRSQPGILWAHNDSGDGPRFFAMGLSGEVVQTFILEGATAVDWEDIALGPCPGGTCLFLGDIGDNSRVRKDYAIYRVLEPQANSGATVVAWERFPFEYPQGEKHNAEAIFMHPISGRLYLVTKLSTAPSEVYRFPLPFDSSRTAILERVIELTVPTITDGPVTAADVNVCGNRVLLRMTNRLVELVLPAGETEFERIFSAEPVPVPVAEEPVGEAVAYGADGETYFTAGERLIDPASLYEHRCR